MSNQDIAVPLIFFSSVVILIGLILAYQLLKKRWFINLIDKHNDMQPESIRAVGRLLFSSKNDLRKGVFLTVVALAIWGFSFMVDFRSGGNLDLNAGLNGVALFPCLAGIAYLILFYVERDK